MEGVITKGIGGFYYVKAADANIYECKARGIFRNEKIIPIVGDKVIINAENGKGSIVKILPRRTQLLRPSVANIDILVLVVAAASPAPNKFLIDKMLINAQINRINPIICINKTDISDGADLKKTYKSAGYKVVMVCAERKIGIDNLINLIKGQVSAFAGLSGVGKSSILSIITKNKLETGEVSEKISRGKHTTRHVELFPLKEGGFVFDTPGFSSIEISGVRPDDLQNYYPEMENAKCMCRFRGCAHIDEPGCAVKALLETGEMYQSRYDSYKEIYKQLKSVKDWETK